MPAREVQHLDDGVHCRLHILLLPDAQQPSLHDTRPCVMFSKEWEEQGILQT